MKKLLLSKFLLFTTVSAFFFSCSKHDNTSNNIPAPTISSLSIDSGIYNTSVLITGTGFSTITSNDKVFFNGKQANILLATSTQLTVNVPLAAGSGRVTLSVSNGSLVSGPVFNYIKSYVVTTFAGSGQSGKSDGQSTAASFDYPWGITIDNNGNLYVADNYDNMIRKITTMGMVTTLAGGGSGITSNGQGSAASFAALTQLCIDPLAGIDIADNTPRTMSNTGLVAAIPATGLNADFYSGIVNISGNVYLADATTNKILKVSPTGLVTTFAGSGAATSIDGTSTSASFYLPYGITADVKGNIYVVESGSGLIRKISPNGVVTTIAGGGTFGTVNNFNVPAGIALDSSGNIYIADTGNNQIEKITPAGVVTVVTSDGGYNSTTFHNPHGLIVDQSGNIYVADSGFNRIQKVSLE